MATWLTDEEARESEVLSRYGDSGTSLHIDHKGRIFVTDAHDSTVVFNEASHAVIVLRKIIELATIRLAELERGCAVGHARVHAALSGHAEAEVSDEAMRWLKDLAARPNLHEHEFAVAVLSALTARNVFNRTGEL